MAVYKFTDSIINKRPIPMFTASQALERDFTFVDDIVGVILAALDHAPQCCGEVYNAGLGEPESLSTLVRLLEEELNSTADTDPSPLLSCDMHMTWADMEETKRVLGYTPRVKLRDGLREFIAWYKHYHSQNKTSERLKELYGEGEVIATMAKGRLEQRIREYNDRINGLKQRYYQYAKDRDIPLPVLTKKRFIFYPGKESPGHTVIKAPSYRGNLKLLEERCLATEQCIAFTSSGEFKNRLTPMNKWVATPQEDGMYVADIDLCASDLHFCGKHSDCVYTGPANYTCACHHGYLKLGQNCVERYVQGDVGATEEEWILSDQFDGFNWEEVVRGRPFVFFQGLDSPGGDYLVVEGRSLEELRDVCLSTRHCLAFNTNGILKDSLRPPSVWGRWAGPQYPQHGLYVLDIDYCSLNLEQCPPHSLCLKNSPGNYSCTCTPPWIPTHDHSCTLDLVHIILSTDSEQLPGLISVINSTLNHTQHSEQIVFHIVFIGERFVIESYLSCYGYSDHPQIDITIFNASLITEPIKVYSKISHVGHLASTGNFARFYFHLLFPELSRAVYLDVDTVVLGDVAEVWSTLQTTNTLLVAAPRISPTYGDMLSVHVKTLFRERYQREFRSDDVTFNAGVYGVNLDLWRENRIHDEVAYWMNQQAKARLWDFGTQPIMLLAAYEQWGHLDPHWNVNGLGWNTEMSRRDLDEAKLLHWSGKRKPWLPDGLYKDLWHAHNPPSCGGHGQCITMETGIYTCHCDSEHTGKLCSQRN
ncbi:uncharacterized protein LOC135350619 [Halichondria panicea]|uniref:uncharacterized protein LOC135350619 n=1 Tax=Halichondria panicea TaxID=6063 RepID=UPI00312BA78B